MHDRIATAQRTLMRLQMMQKERTLVEIVLFGITEEYAKEHNTKKSIDKNEVNPTIFFRTKEIEARHKL